MTLQDYIQTLPKDRVQLAANDLEEAAKIEREHAVLPNAVFDTAEQIDGRKLDQPQVPQNSFDIGSEDETKKFISGMEVSHPELVNQLRRDETAWGKMLQVDAANTARLQRDGGIKFTGDEKSDYDFFRWAYGRGMMESDTSAGGLASAFGRGLWQMVKGAGKLGYTAGKAVLTQDPAAAGELAATTVDAAQSAVAEYQQLGAGIAALTSGDNPQVKMAAMYELAKFSDQEQKNHNAWRKAVSDSFAEVPVDEDSVEFMSEAFDISNLIGAGAGKFVTRGAKGVGMGGVADVLGKGRKVWGSDKAAELFAKVPVIGRAHQRAIYMGQADLLSIEAQVAYEEVAQEQARLAALRSTLTNNPSWSSKDVLLKQIASAETAVAEKTAVFDAAKGQLDDVRGKITSSLNLEGRGLLNRAAAGTLDLTGRATSGTGRAISRVYRGASEFLTGEADNAAFDMAAGKVVPGVMSKGNLLTRVGTDMQVAARTMGQNGSSIPYFRRLARAEDASKMTRAASAFMDSSHLAWAADKAADLAQAGAAGAPISGAFGYLSSGGDLAAAAESAGAGSAYGIGGGAYGQWQAYKDPGFRYEELLANRRMFRDMLSRREVNGASQLQVFDRLDAGDQIALATYAQAKPDVSFRLIHEPSQASGYYDRDNNVVVINTASSTAIPDIFRHEVAHFVERHGLEAQVRELYLGDAEKGVVGQYTEMDKLGNPVFVESTGPDGEKQYSYKLNAEGERLRNEYQKKIRAVDPTFTMSDQYLASELFAEQYADRLLSGSFRRDLGRNAVDNVVDALASKPLLKEFMGQIGLLFDQNDKVVGTGVFKELKANPQVDKLISRWNSDIAKGAKPAMTEEADDHVFTERELRDPVVATKWLQSGGAMRFGPDGKPVYDANGVPQFLTEKEAEAQQRDLANELITQIERYNADNPNDPDLIQRREIMDVKGVTRTVFSGRRIPAQVIDALEAQNRFNPHQIAFLRAMSASVEKHGVGAMVAHFYQAAMRKLGGSAYKTVAGRWRRDGVVGFQITKDGNVVINSVSWEQLNENAKKAAKAKQAREVYATAGVPIESAITADVKTYLGNLVDGKPGATDIGEARRDFINNLLGIRMAANADVNPLFETTSAPKTILTNLRLDRMNRVAPLDYVEYAWGPQQYRQAKKNARPDDAAMGPEDSQLEGFYASMRESIADRIKNTPRSDYAEGDTLYTPNGTAVKFISDLLTVRKGKNKGLQRAYVEMPNGNQTFFLLRDLSPEKPAFPASGGRDLGPNSEFAVPPADADAKASLSSDRQPKYGLARNLEPGTFVGLRIDIPAFQRTGNYVISVHEQADGKTVGKIIGYDNVVRVNNPRFMLNQEGAAKIKAGEKNKFPIATVEGAFNPSREIPKDINEWTAVGFDPLDHSYFYDKRTDQPVVGGREAISVGNTVFVKDPVYSSKDVFQYRPDADGVNTSEGSTNERNPSISTTNEDAGSLAKQRRFRLDPDTRGAANAFREAITAAAENHPAGKAVTIKELAEYERSQLFLAEDKSAGVAVTPEGDLVSVFKAKGSKTDINEILSEAAPASQTLDAYTSGNGFLPNLYAKHGFRPVARVEFNPDFAPEGWPYERLGKPDLVYMVRDPEGVSGHLKLDGDYAEHEADIPLVSYDEAVAMQRAAADRVRQSSTQYRPESGQMGDSENLTLGQQALALAETTTLATGTDIAKFLGKLARRNGSGLDFETPRAREKLAKLFDAELDHALTMPDNANALGWYSKEMKVVFDILRSPELGFQLDNEVNRGVFNAILAITSNGQKVIPQFLKTAELYEAWRKDGSIPDISDWGGERNEAIRGHLDFLNTLIAHVGPERTVEYLKSERPISEHVENLYLMVAEAKGLPADATVKEMETAIKKHLGVKVGGGELKTYAAVGAIAFGPKLGGGFFANLYGKYDRLTMDRWFMRTFHRLTGRLGKMDPVAAEGAVSRVREALQESFVDTEEAGLSDAKVLNYLKAEGKKAYKDYKAINAALEANPEDASAALRNEIRLAFNQYKKATSGMYDSPDNGSHRAFIRSVIDRVHELRAERGAAPIDTSDIQAVLWYLEKDIWARLKSKDKGVDDADVLDVDSTEPDDFAGRVSYSDGARELFRLKTGKEYSSAK